MYALVYVGNVLIKLVDNKVTQCVNIEVYDTYFDRSRAVCIQAFDWLRLKT